MTGRYERMFESGQPALIPFLMCGDPDPARFLAHVDALVGTGADALELGIPFSDPVADGPTVVAASIRARQAGVDPERALRLVAEIRERHPQLPIGLLVYANLVFAKGLERFYEAAADAGVDSVLVPDAPLREVGPFVAAAAATRISQVLILPPDPPETTLRDVARQGSAYTYVLGRKGVTGAHGETDAGLDTTIARLRSVGGPPPVVGFGITGPTAIGNALDAGADGVIVGSALIDAIVAGEDVAAFVRKLKKACRT